MSEPFKTLFTLSSPPKNGVLVILTDDKLALGKEAARLNSKSGGLVVRGAKISAFKGERGRVVNLLAPKGLGLDQLIVLGCGKTAAMKSEDWVKLGGRMAQRLGELGVSQANVLCEIAGQDITPDNWAGFAIGARLACYSFDAYFTTKKTKPKGVKLKKLTFHVADVSGTKAASVTVNAVSEGVELARDLVNQPANILGPVEFAAQCAKLSELGVKVTILTEKEMSKLGMGALLGVGQGSPRGSRLAVMEWNGGAKNVAPVAFVGKGVTFDSGGISIKPAASMEDMKGDMAGAACVTGLMHALAKRGAKANVVAVIGFVENMPDGNAQRPGDIVTSMSGQTIEIINTDAEGRLVLADALWYCQQQFKPQFMVNLATLTGAILVALGQDYAGLFSNNDELSTRISACGEVTGEKVWRMPMGDCYDKIINSKFADMKNSGGRFAGSITAAQFLARFVNNTPWAHLDIAGTGMGVSPSDINRSWGPGFGVRLLNQLVADYYETKPAEQSA